MRRLLLLPLAAWLLVVFALGVAAVIEEGSDGSTVAAGATIGRASLDVVPDAAADPRPGTTTPTPTTTTRPGDGDAPEDGVQAPGPTVPERETTTTSRPARSGASTAPAPAPPPAPAPAPTTAPAPPGVPRTRGQVLLVWTSGGLPAGFSQSVTSIEQVTAHTTVLGDLIRLVGSRDAAGATVDRAPEGWAWPIDAFAVEPSSYASFQSGADVDVLAALRPGGAVLTRTSAALRRIGVGGVLAFAGGEVTVTGVVDDVHGGGAEVLVHRDDAARLGIDDERFLLLTDTDRAAVEDAIRARTPAGEFLSLRSEAEAPFLRHGDRVDPQVLVKRTFGEFLFQDAGGRDIRMEQAWIDANIVRTEVPLLGAVTCHRAIIPALRAAMTELEQSGRGDTVDRSRYAGCWNPRRIAAGAGLSRHTWGLALDLNIGSNPRGTFDSQDPALFGALESRGFNWGGRWEYPDPGHYEMRA